MKRLLIGLMVGVVLALGVGYGWLLWYGQASQDPEFFESDIQAFEAEGRRTPPPEGVVVFTGSSSVRLWSTLTEDMAPIPVLNRGFGGSQMSHVVHFAERVVSAYKPRAVVVYAGDNDLDESTGKTAATVVEDFEKFVALVRAAQPDLRIYYLTIKPSVLRWDRWPEMDRANREIERLAAADRHMKVIDIGPATLGSDGKPDPDLFLFDGLHLNASGYERWTAVTRSVLLPDLGFDPPLPSPGP